MSLGPRLEIKVSQGLVISPQLRAAIKLLTLSNLEIQTEIARELAENPLLSLAGDQEGISAEAAAPDTETTEGATETTVVDELLSEPASSDLDLDLSRDCFIDDSPSEGVGQSHGDDTHDFLISQYAGEEESLASVLERQVDGLPVEDRPLALLIVAAIDDAGYLRDPLSDIAVRAGVEIGEAERVLALVHGFEPTGVGARDLAECIALQAKAADRYDPWMAALIANLDVVARGDLAALQRLCSVDEEELADMLQELRGYDPKPGLQHGGGVASVVVPDVFVRRKGGGWAVELNRSSLPEIVIDRKYRDGLGTGRNLARTERRFIGQCMSRGRWLLRTLEQRAQTILKVSAALVSYQEGFFEKGVHHLRPLTLRTIAEMVDLHESTVSRVVSGKYLSCERGTFELRYFFTTAIVNSDGSEISAEAVRERLRELIQEEEPLKPLADGALVDLLKAEGHDIARRTVAKYREAMGIPSSFQRRRQARITAH